MINNLKVKYKMFLGFGSITLILSLFALFVINRMNKIDSGLENDLSIRQKYDAAKSVQLYVANVWQFLTDACLTKDETALKEAEENYLKGKENLILLLKFEKNNIAMQDLIKNTSEQLEGMFNTGKDMFNGYKVSYELGDKKMEIFDKSCSVLIERLQDIVNYTKKESATVNKETREIVASGILNTVLIMILSFISAIIISLFVTYKITNPLIKLTEGANSLALGNTDTEIKINSKDEVGLLSQSFNTAVRSVKQSTEKLEAEKRNVENKIEKAIKESEEQKNYLTQSVEKMLIEIKKFSEGDLTVNLIAEKDDDIKKLYDGFNKSVKNISSLIENVTESVQATASASTQISSSTEELAAGSQEQSVQTTEVASAVEEMTKTIIETTTNASRASESAKTSGNIAQDGGKVVSETIEGMNKIAEVVTQAAETVKELGSNSDKIGEIIQVIDDIADQTNLLALNAAIEAARAGEQGRGFAVVADEVRKLAERTTKATKEIAAMIKQIQKDTGNAVTSMEKGVEEVNSGKHLAEKAGESLSQIINSTKEVIDNIAQVAAASEEQSSAAEQISKNVESISSVTQQSSAGTTQIARAAEDLNRLTDNLQNLVSRFKIDSKENKSSYSIRQNGKLVEG